MRTFDGHLVEGLLEDVLTLQNQTFPEFRLLQLFALNDKSVVSARYIKFSPSQHLTQVSVNLGVLGFELSLAYYSRHYLFNRLSIFIENCHDFLTHFIEVIWCQFIQSKFNFS